MVLQLELLAKQGGYNTALHFIIYVSIGYNFILTYFRIIDIKELEKDFKRMASLVQVLSVGLMGGEPLLHPNLIEILNEHFNRVHPKDIKERIG